MKEISIYLMIILIVPSCRFETTTDMINQKSKDTQIYFGEIIPKGWMAAQMKGDIKDGFVANLDQLVPDLIIEDDIYGADRLTKKIKKKDVGAITNDHGEWEVQFLWWNSETQSNWWDGYIRNAILTQDKNALEKVEQYVSNKLATQDEDGYMGVYAPDLRYKHITENGELWAQSSLFRGLLAYYEYSKDAKVLNAIESAVQRTMTAYPINASQPFNIEKPYAGVGHGLTFVDVLSRLYQLTEKKEYIDYAMFLFEDYNNYDLSEVDIQTKNLLNPEYRFVGHGVHTYEHLRALTLVAKNSTNETYTKALKAYLERLEKVTTPSGAPIGDEWVFGRTANADNTGYEYCSIHELLDSYALLLELTGESKWADKMEWLLFNAGQGSRHPDGKSIAYCKTDNSYFMEGALEKENIGKDNHNRYKYSPAHQDVAVCCVPNAGRIYPYYVNSMWRKTDVGLQLNLFGASEIATSINGHSVKIIQETNYPFDFNIQLKVETDSPENFQIAIRKPQWAKSFKAISEAKQTEKNQYILLDKKWQSGDVITVVFEAELIVSSDLQNDKFISYGPIVFGLPIEAKEVIKKDYGFNDFYDLEYHSGATLENKWKLPQNISSLEIIKNDESNLWDRFQIKTMAVNSENLSKQVTLRPMGNLILRQVTFPEKQAK